MESSSSSTLIVEVGKAESKSCNLEQDEKIFKGEKNQVKDKGQKDQFVLRNGER